VSLYSTIELTGVPIKAQIGIFKADEPDLYEHTLDLTLKISPSLVFIQTDGMAQVFDYDPLLEHIHRVSQDTHYETQEMLASRIVQCCARFEEIVGVEVCLKKSRSNGVGGTVCGTIGVRLSVTGDDLASARDLPLG